MTISKDFRFPVSVHWQGEQVVRLDAPDVEELDVSVPPEFQGPDGYWSAEQLLVASVATCYAVTFAAVADRRGIPLRSLAITGTGHVAHRDDGRVGFVAVELTPRIQTEPEFVGAAERTARTVDTACLITRALAVPVEVTPIVRAVEPAVA